MERIDFLEIDVEGFEFEVLKGAEAMLADKRITTIQFEFGGRAAMVLVFATF